MLIKPTTDYAECTVMFASQSTAFIITYIVCSTMQIVSQPANCITACRLYHRLQDVAHSAGYTSVYTRTCRLEQYADRATVCLAQNVAHSVGCKHNLSTTVYCLENVVQCVGCSTICLQYVLCNSVLPICLFTFLKHCHFDWGIA